MSIGVDHLFSITIVVIKRYNSLESAFVKSYTNYLHELNNMIILYFVKKIDINQLFQVMQKGYNQSFHFVYREQMVSFFQLGLISENIDIITLKECLIISMT